MLTKTATKLGAWAPSVSCTKPITGIVCWVILQCAGCLHVKNLADACVAPRASRIGRSAAVVAAVRAPLFGCSIEENRLKTTAILLFCFVLGCCFRGSDAPRATDIDPTLPPPPPGSVFPESRPADSALRERLKHVKSFGDLFEVETVADLGPGFALSDFSKGFVHPDGFLVLLDNHPAQIVVFDLAGRAIGAIGRVGEGPGEFAEPHEIRLGFDNTIIVNDQLGRVHAFRRDGTHLLSTRFALGLNLFYSGAALMPRADRILVSGLHSQKHRGPLHAVLAWDGSEARELHRFGRRMFSSEVNRWSHNRFQMIDGRVWYHSPLRSHFEIYDEDGRYLGATQALRGATRPHATEVAALRPLNKDTINTYLRKRYAPYSYFRVGDMVVADSLRTFDLYGLGGVLLAEGLTRSREGVLLGGHQGRLISVISALDRFDLYRDALKAQVTAVCDGDPARLADSNGFLVIWRMKD